MTPSPRHQLIARRRALALLAGSAGLTLAAACAPIEPPDDKRVRQAFNLALDRQRILDRVYAGVGETACIPFPKTSPGYHAATAGSCTFDLDASRKLLTEAGSTTDAAKRKELYAQVNRLVVEECFVLSVTSLPQVWAMAPYVRDFAWNLDGHEILENAWLDA